MEDIDFLKTDSKGSAKKGQKDIEYTKPEKQAKPKKKQPQKKKLEEPKKKEKKGFFSGLFGSKKKKEEKPEPSGESKAPLPPLKPEEKQALDKLISEESKPKEPSPLISEKPILKPKPKPQPKPTTPTVPTTPTPELEQTVEKIKNGEIPLEALDVNLIPKEMLQDLKPERKLINLLWICLAACLLVVTIYGFMFYLQSRYLTQAEINHQKIEELEDEILAYKPLQEEIFDYNKKIEDVNELLERHIYWNVFFFMLEENTLPTVTITNMTGGITEPFTIAAEAPDYKTVTSQIEVFKQAKNFIKTVEINSATATNPENGEAGGVAFTATLTVEDGIFIRQKE